MLTYLEANSFLYAYITAKIALCSKIVPQHPVNIAFMHCTDRYGARWDWNCCNIFAALFVLSRSKITLPYLKLGKFTSILFQQGFTSIPHHCSLPLFHNAKKALNVIVVESTCIATCSLHDDVTLQWLIMLTYMYYRQLIKSHYTPFIKNSSPSQTRISNFIQWKIS